MTHGDCLNVSSIKRKTIFLSSVPKPVDLNYETVLHRKKGFPLSTRGFLYYHDPHPLPGFLGHLRFRVTPTNDPSTFKQGHDLLLPSREPWQYPLLSKRNPGITDILLSQLQHEGLIDERTTTQLDQLHRHFGLAVPAISDIITRLGQEFFYNFLCGEILSIINISEQGELLVGKVTLRISNMKIPYEEKRRFQGELFSNYSQPRLKL